MLHLSPIPLLWSILVFVLEAISVARVSSLLSGGTSTVKSNGGGCFRGFISVHYPFAK